GRRLVQTVGGLGHRRIAVVAAAEALRTVGGAGTGGGAEPGGAGIARPGDRRAAAEAARHGGGNPGPRRRHCREPPTPSTAARDVGMTVPDEVSICGFDDIPNVLDTVPPLTTIRIPLRSIGRRAMELALSGEVQVEHVGLDLILRGSVAKPPR